MEYTEGVRFDSLGLSPEIMRAIAEDTKIQSVKKEIEDEEASVGNRLRGDGGAESDEARRAEEE